jgi:lysophospholipase
MRKEVLQLNQVFGRIKSILDEEYQEKMKRDVENMLNGVSQCGYFSREADRNLYYEKYLSPQAEKNIVICHGFTENSEKYKEMIYYFYHENCNVFILDHQGHGKSFRLVEDYSITHVERFIDYVEDFRAFMNQIVKPDCGQNPIILYAHSMGGAIGGTYLEKYPNDFSKAIFSSPMFEIDSGRTPKWVGRLIADIKIATGHKKDYLFIHSRFNEKERFEDSCAVSRIRYDYFFQKRLVNKEYQNYCASYSWLRQSIIATRNILKKQNLSKIKIPVMIFQAEKDTVVRPNGQNRFARGVADSLLVFVPESKHEIFMTQSKILTPYLNKIFGFIN